jgi:hypothetical protein
MSAEYGSLLGAEGTLNFVPQPGIEKNLALAALDRILFKPIT